MELCSGPELWRIQSTSVIDQLMIAAARIDLAGDHSAAQHLGMASSPVGVDHKTIGEGPANIHPNSMCITCLHDRVDSCPTPTCALLVIVIETRHSTTKTRSRVSLSIDHRREDTSRKRDSMLIEEIHRACSLLHCSLDEESASSRVASQRLSTFAPKLDVIGRYFRGAKGDNDSFLV